MSRDVVKPSNKSLAELRDLADLVVQSTGRLVGCVAESLTKPLKKDEEITASCTMRKCEPVPDQEDQVLISELQIVRRRKK